MTSVRPSVRNVSRLWWQRNKKCKWAYDKIGRCIGYLHAKGDPHCGILWSLILLRKTSIAKCEVVHFGGNNLRNCASYAATIEHLTGNFLRQLELYHLRAHTATGGVGITFGSRRILVQQLACRIILTSAELLDLQAIASSE